MRDRNIEVSDSRLVPLKILRDRGVGRIVVQKNQADGPDDEASVKQV